ncbi:MAG: hypothetical protein JWM21_1128 [Acidobacteria bacterium]|nr:hypothetical protein [Acidobacteriota bacterium]
MGAQTNSDRELIKAFDRQFARLYSHSCVLVSKNPIALLYLKPAVSLSNSIGENLLRSAAAIEQTFGGITANLWDDPFEWTLPENLATTERLLEYLAEVEATRLRAFARFAHDSDLLKEVLVPAGNTRPLVDLLAETLVKAADYQGRALATLGFISNDHADGSVNVSAGSNSNAV